LTMHGLKLFEGSGFWAAALRGDVVL